MNIKLTDEEVEMLTNQFMFDPNSFGLNAVRIMERELFNHV